MYYVALVVVVAIFVALCIAPRYGNTYVAVYIYICASIGSLSVMCCKGLGLSIREAIAGQNPLLNMTSALFLIALIICITVQVSCFFLFSYAQFLNAVLYVFQMNYLNKSLDTFNTAVVNPLYYVFFTTSVIVASSILFEEWRFMMLVDVLSTLTGLLIIIIALFMISAFKNVPISLMDLYSSKSGPRTTRTSY